MPNITGAQGRTELYSGTGVSDNDLLFTTANTQLYNYFQLMTSAGNVDVEVLLGGTLWSTVAIALEDMGATANGTYVIATAANGRMYRFRGKFTSVRVRQNGATAATAQLLCGIG